MKSLFMTLALFFAFAGVARAEQIDLYTTAGSGCLHQYHYVDSSLGVATVDIWAPQLAGSTGGMSLKLAGSDELFTGTFYGSGVPTVLTGATSGNQITVTFAESWYRVLSGAGRGRYWCYRWTLQSGTIVR